MHAENGLGVEPEASRSGLVLAAPWAWGLAGALVLLLATVEGAHWATSSGKAELEQVVQQPVLATSPSSHPDVSAPDPGDNP